MCIGILGARPHQSMILRIQCIRILLKQLILCSLLATYTSRSGAVRASGVHVLINSTHEEEM
jgi:hypothetical protein